MSNTSSRVERAYELARSEYASLGVDTDAAIGKLQQALFSGKRPAILAHFGDHQPSFDGLLLGMDSTAAAKALGEERSVTYYMLRGNQAAAEKFDYPLLDIGFLAGLILDSGAIPKDAFFEANTRLRKRCHGHYMDCHDVPLLESYLSFLFNNLHAIER